MRNGFDPPPLWKFPYFFFEPLLSVCRMHVIFCVGGAEAGDLEEPGGGQQQPGPGLRLQGPRQEEQGYEELPGQSSEMI